MRSMFTSYADDAPTFQHARNDMFWLGRRITLVMTDDELHQLRLAIDLVDDVKNGPMR